MHSTIIHYVLVGGHIAWLPKKSILVAGILNTLLRFCYRYRIGLSGVIIDGHRGLAAQLVSSGRLLMPNSFVNGLLLGLL